MTARPTRRHLLAGLGAGLGASLTLPGCAAWVHAGDSAGPATRATGTGIGIVIFEAVKADFPFHTAAVLETPQGRALYDPGGWWADGQGQRVCTGSTGPCRPTRRRGRWISRRTCRPWCSGCAAGA